MAMEGTSMNLEISLMEIMITTRKLGLALIFTPMEASLREFTWLMTGRLESIPTRRDGFMKGNSTGKMIEPGKESLSMLMEKSTREILKRENFKAKE